MAPVRFDDLATVTVTDGCTDRGNNESCISTKTIIIIAVMSVQFGFRTRLTSGPGAGVERQTACDSLQDLLLGLWALFFLIKLLLSFG